MNPLPIPVRLNRLERIVVCTVFTALTLSAALLFYSQKPLEARHRPWTGPHVGSDGWYYYHNLRSLALDGDLDLANEYQRFGNWYGYQRGRNGRYRNPFGVGPALVWLPAFYIGHFVATVATHKERHQEPNGYSPIEQSAVLTTTLVAGLLTLLFSYLLCRRFTQPFPAAMATVVRSRRADSIWLAMVRRHTSS